MQLINLQLLSKFHAARPDRSRVQARSQKFAMGGCFGFLEAEPPAAGGQWGFGGKPQPPEAGGLGAKAIENFAFFGKNNSTLGLF